MAWVDLGDLYVKKAGDSVTGSIVMANNNLSVAYDADTTYNVGTEIKSLRDSVSRKQARLDRSLTCYTEGGICILSLDYLKVTQKGVNVKLGNLPDGLKPLGQAHIDQVSNEDIAYIGPLRYRGDNNIYGQVMVTNSGTIMCYVSDAGPTYLYFYGQLVFPVTRP